MSNRLGGFIAGQNINVSIGAFTAANSPDLTFGSAAGTPAVGQPVQFTTTGTLPTGISLNTTYYVRSVSSNTCQVSTTQGGSATTYTNGTGSGTHTAVTQRAFNPYAGAPDTVEYLVVAGGGGGGAMDGATFNAGGGGAGGLLTAAGFSVASGTALTVTVGAGGAGGTSVSLAASNGQNSVFSSITALGGGGGGGRASAANSGGSGGGGGTPANGGQGAGTAGQGNAGGAASANTGGYLTGGGGGGAGSAGTAGSSNATTNSVSGSGGTGLCSTITGQRVFYAGGGSTGGYKAGQAGAGGGGNGATNGTPATAGQANTGGGGGADNYYSLSQPGGSGVVIIRYPQINSAPAMVTGSPQVNYSDGYQIYTWTSSGSIIF